MLTSALQPFVCYNELKPVFFFFQNIELKVELESMKRELAEKQELLVSAS